MSANYRIFRALKGHAASGYPLNEPADSQANNGPADWHIDKLKGYPKLVRERHGRNSNGSKGDFEYDWARRIVNEAFPFKDRQYSTGQTQALGDS